MVAATNVTEDSMAPMTLCTKNVSDLKCNKRGEILMKAEQQSLHEEGSCQSQQMRGQNIADNTPIS